MQGADAIPWYGVTNERNNPVKCPRCDSHRLFESQSGSRRLPFPLSVFLVSVRRHKCLGRFLARSRLLAGSVREWR
jgi:hypothetical protein